jgi:hypothetical protein
MIAEVSLKTERIAGTLICAKKNPAAKMGKTATGLRRGKYLHFQHVQTIRTAQLLYKYFPSIVNALCPACRRAEF